MNRLWQHRFLNRKTVLLVSALIIWCGLTSVLMRQLCLHDTSSVAVSSQLREAVSRPPVEAELQSFDIRRLKIELYIHPECPCTQVTLRAMASLQVEFPNLPSPTVYIASYPGELSDWKNSSNYRAVEGMHPTAVFEDPLAIRAKSLGATGSGTIRIAGVSGELEYLGGITDGRDCPKAGPNYHAIREYLKLGKTTIDHFQVFGCKL